MKRRIVEWHHPQDEPTLARLNCGHHLPAGSHLMGDEVDCPECHNDCSICGSPPVVQNTLRIQGQIIPVHLCRFCALGVCRDVSDANTLMVVRHISLVAHELLAEIRRAR